MKAMLKLLASKKWLAMGVIAVLMVTSCSDDDENPITNDSELAAVSEAEIDAVYEDIDDLSALSVLFSESLTGGRVEENPDDDRFCGIFAFEGDKTAGTITLDFGEGCEDSRGNVRKGKVIIQFEGGRFVPGSSVEITLIDYSINDIALEGVRRLENISATLEDYPTFRVTLTGGKATWPDGTSATREVNRVRVWVNAANPLNDEHRVTGTANGTTRRGVGYEMLITDTLVYRRACRLSGHARIPVSGTKVITTDNNVITLDFGDGTCDRKLEITVNGNTREVTL